MEQLYKTPSPNSARKFAPFGSVIITGSNSIELTALAQLPEKLGRRERKKEETRQAILTAAAELFRTRGYEASSVEDIAEAADVAKRTLYNTFVSKEEIVIALRFQSFDLHIEKACAMARNGKSPLEAIETFLLATARWASDNPELSQVLFAHGPVMPPPPKFDADGAFPIAMPAFVRGLLELVVLAQRKGELRADVDAHFMVHMIGFVIVYTNLESFRTRMTSNSVKLAKSSFKALLRGLQAP